MFLAVPAALYLPPVASRIWTQTRGEGTLYWEKYNMYPIDHMKQHTRVHWSVFRTFFWKEVAQSMPLLDHLLNLYQYGIYKLHMEAKESQKYEWNSGQWKWTSVQDKSIEIRWFVLRRQHQQKKCQKIRKPTLLMTRILAPGSKQNIVIHACDICKV